MEIKMLVKQSPSGRMLINFYRLHLLDIPKIKMTQPFVFPGKVMHITDYSGFENCV